MLLRDLTTLLERKFSPILGKLLYPPTGVNILCWSDKKKKDIVVLRIGNKIDLPGGMLNSGEHPSEAAKREFKEETGLKCKVSDLIEIKKKWNGISGLHIFYEAELVEDFENRNASWEGKPEILPVEDADQEISNLIRKAKKSK